MKDRKALTSTTIIFLLLGLLILLLILAYLPIEHDFWIFKGWDAQIKIIGKYLFGVEEEKLTQVAGEGTLRLEAVIITAIMLWLIIFLIFGDILSTFSPLNTTASWIIAFALGVIAALTGGISSGVGWLVKTFAKTAFGIFIIFGSVALLLFILGLFFPAIRRWNRIRKTRMAALKKVSKAKIAGEATKHLEEIEEELGE